MTLKAIILTLAVALALSASAPAMALELQPRLNQQVLESYYLAGRNMAVLKQRAILQHPTRNLRLVPVRFQVRLK